MRRTAPTTLDGDVHVRTYRPSDRPWLRRLYEEGRLAGQVRTDDPATDIDDVPNVYLAERRGHFWVADLHGRIVGMVGVIESGPYLAQVRRLRVDPAFRHLGVEVRLMHAALEFCRHHGYLKVVLDTGFEEAPAIDLFDRFAFRHYRTRQLAGQDVAEFYLDLYRDPRPNDEAGQPTHERNSN